MALPRNSSRLATTLTAAIGLTSGVLGGALVSMRPSPSVVPRAGELPLAPPPVVLAGGAPPLGASLAMTRGPVQDTAPIVAAASEAEAYDPPLPEEAAAEHLRAHTRARDAIRQESRDPTWARRTESALRADFDALRATGATPTRVDCYRESCVVELEWESYEAALQTYTQILQHPFSAACGRETLLPEPARTGGGYSASMLFRCEELSDG